MRLPATEEEAVAETSRLWAEFRLAVVGHLVVGDLDRGQLGAELKSLSAKKWKHPITGTRVTFGYSTIERWYTQSLIEQFAPQQPLLKLVVEYKRRGKQLRRVESIIKAIRRGRVYPLFSQTRDGRISSTDPDLFADDGLERLCDCIGGEPAVWLQDKRRSLDQVQQVSGDLTLKRDRTGPGQLNLFMKNQAIMAGVDHDDLLLRVLIGESSHRLSTRFLVDRLTVNNIFHVLEARYPRVFHYVADARAQGLKQGYVERGGLRRLGRASVQPQRGRNRDK